MVCLCPHDGRLSRISSSLSSQHHSSFVLANSNFVGCHELVGSVVGYRCSGFATNLLTASAVSLVQPCLARKKSYSPVLGQVAGSQQDSVEQE